MRPAVSLLLQLLAALLFPEASTPQGGLPSCACRVCVAQLGRTLEECSAKLGLDCSCYTGDGGACPCAYCTGAMKQTRTACEQLLGLNCACLDAGASGGGVGEQGLCALTGGDFCVVLADLRLNAPLTPGERDSCLEDVPMALADGMLLDCDGSVVAGCDDPAIRSLDVLSIAVAPFDEGVADPSELTVEFAVPSAASGEALLELFRMELTDRTSSLMSYTDDTDILTRLVPTQAVDARVVDTSLGETDGICESLSERVAQVHSECCPGEGSCGSGMPTTCERGCAAVLLPFIADCSARLAESSGEAFDFSPVRRLCLLAQGQSGH
jgi:hypothetical protein